MEQTPVKEDTIGWITREKNGSLKGVPQITVKTQFNGGASHFSGDTMPNTADTKTANGFLKMSILFMFYLRFRHKAQEMDFTHYF